MAQLSGSGTADMGSVGSAGSVGMIDPEGGEPARPGLKRPRFCANMGRLTGAWLNSSEPDDVSPFSSDAAGKRGAVGGVDDSGLPGKGSLVVARSVASGEDAAVVLEIGAAAVEAGTKSLGDAPAGLVRAAKALAGARLSSFKNTARTFVGMIDAASTNRPNVAPSALRPRCIRCQRSGSELIIGPLSALQGEDRGLDCKKDRFCRCLLEVMVNA